jgi:rhodanese-related sulfurtransferase
MKRACTIALITLASFAAGCGGGKQDSAKALAEHPEATPAEMAAPLAKAYLGDHPEALVLDVREVSEWNDDLGHIAAAKQIPLGELPARLGEIEAWKDKPIIVVCRSGVRSKSAVETLHGAGFKLAVNLAGGMSAWRAAGY